MSYIGSIGSLNGRSEMQELQEKVPGIVTKMLTVVTTFTC